MLFKEILKDFKKTFFKDNFVTNYLNQCSFVPYNGFEYDKVFFKAEIIHDLEKVLSKATNDRVIMPFKFNSFFKQTEREVIDFSIKKLFGLTNSKSSGFDSLMDFANQLKIADEKNKHNLIRFQTDQDFQDNIIHLQKRFRNEEYFTVYHQKWNDRFFIQNADGSHHFGALYRQCHEQNRDYKIKAQIIEYTIEIDYLRGLLSDFYFILTMRKNSIKLYSLYNDFNFLYYSYTFYESQDGEENLLILDKKVDIVNPLVSYIKNQGDCFQVLNDSLTKKYCIY